MFRENTFFRPENVPPPESRCPPPHPPGSNVEICITKKLATVTSINVHTPDTNMCYGKKVNVWGGGVVTCQPLYFDNPSLSPRYDKLVCRVNQNTNFSR